MQVILAARLIGVNRGARKDVLPDEGQSIAFLVHDNREGPAAAQRNGRIILRRRVIQMSDLKLGGNQLIHQIGFYRHGLLVRADRRPGNRFYITTH
jgi:hypothetical protein